MLKILKDHEIEVCSSDGVSVNVSDSIQRLHIKLSYVMG